MEALESPVVALGLNFAQDSGTNFDGYSGME